MLPQIAAALQPVTLQVTAVLLFAEVTVGVNCTVPPAGTLALVGAMEIVTEGAVRVTTAVATWVVSAWDVAVTVTVLLVVTLVGAVYRPVELMVPITASPPASPLTAHFTAVLVEPVTIAVNCCVVPPATFAVVGETVIETVVVVLFLLPPQPAQSNATATSRGRNRFLKTPR
jgi:hypothetical protein